MIQLKNFILLIFIVFATYESYSQRETNVWYFGNKAGLDFNSGQAEPIYNSAMNTWEGCSTISDSLGNLLFYTDGLTVWNKNHTIMKDGSGLLGDSSSTQAALIVKQPGANPIYYIFTTDDLAGENGLRYTVVDISGENGLGNVVSDKKNIQILAPCTERVAAVSHANNHDIWILTHAWNNAQYLAYLLTESGLQTPVVSEIGSVHGEDPYGYNINSIGYLKANSQGTKIACATAYNSLAEIFDFENHTGILTNPLTLVFPQIEGTYGVEFSPRSTKFYVTSTLQLFQFDLLAGTPEEIQASRVELLSFDTYPSAIQAAPDGKIYLSQNQKNYISVIHYPDSAGIECTFVKEAIPLLDKKTRRGLPNLNHSLYLPFDFDFMDNCFGDTTHFFLTASQTPDSVSWNFGDSESGTGNYSKLFSPEHFYQSPGFYDVVLTMWISGIAAVSRRKISILAPPELYLGNDTILCPQAELILKIENRNLDVVWNNLSTSHDFIVNTAGTYFIDAVNRFTGCRNSDTIHIDYTGNPEIILGNDTAFCKNTSFTINAFHPNYSYLWNTNETESSITVYSPGEYFVKVTDSLKCENADTIILSHYPLPEFSLGNDTVICNGTTLFLETKYPQFPCLWSNQSTEPHIWAATAGEYFLTVSDSVSCTFTDTIRIAYKGLPEFRLLNDTVVCENSVLSIKPDTIFTEITSFHWNDGSETPFLEISQTGTYTLLAEDKCGQYTDSVYVEFEYCGPVDIPNIFTPNKDGINDIFYIKGIEEERWILNVWNRWGNSVYKSDNYKNDWQPEKISSDVYYFILEEFSGPREYKGFVHIISD